MADVTFTVYGEPMGKQRPRFARQGNYTKTYTPQKTVNYEELIKFEYYNHYKGMQFTADEPLSMVITAYVGIPQSASKKKQEMMRQGLIKPTKKPDWDNIAKIIGDALNKTAYPDDKQIVDARIIKEFSIEPRVEVHIWSN